MTSLSTRQRELLAPFVERYRQIAVWPEDASAAFTAQVKAAAAACTVTNCGWDEYRTAQIVLEAIRGLERQRASEQGRLPEGA